jgi:hypothetical protein
VEVFGMEAFSLVRAELSGDYAVGLRRVDSSCVRGDFATGVRTIAAPQRVGDFAVGHPGRVGMELTTGCFGTGVEWVPAREPWTRWSVEITVRREPARGLSREA